MSIVSLCGLVYCRKVAYFVISVSGIQTYRVSQRGSIRAVPGFSLKFNDIVDLALSCFYIAVS